MGTLAAAVGTATAAAPPALGAVGYLDHPVLAVTAPVVAPFLETAASAVVPVPAPAGMASRTSSPIVAWTIPEVPVAAVRSCPAVNPVAAGQAGTVDPAAHRARAGARTGTRVPDPPGAPAPSPQRPGTPDPSDGARSAGSSSEILVVAAAAAAGTDAGPGRLVAAAHGPFCGREQSPLDLPG